MITDTQQKAEAAMKYATEVAQAADEAEEDYKQLSAAASKTNERANIARNVWIESAKRAVDAHKVSQVAWNEWALEAAQIAEDKITTWAERAEKAVGPKVERDPRYTTEEYNDGSSE